MFTSHWHFLSKILDEKFDVTLLYDRMLNMKPVPSAS